MEPKNELMENFTNVLENMNMKATAEAFRKEISRKSDF